VKRITVVCFVLFALAAPSAFADDPLTGVGDLLKSGHAAEARARVLKARDAFVAQHDASGEAACYLLLGLSEAGLEDKTAARADLDQAVTKFLALDEHLGAWMSLATLAMIESVTGRTAEALALHEKAIDVLHKAAEPSSRFSVQAIGVLGTVFGAPPEQVQLLSAAPELVKVLMLPLAESMSRIMYGQALIETGELEKAEEQLTQAALRTALYGDMFQPLIATPMGDLRRQQWRFDEARQYYQKALGSVGSMPSVFMASGPVELDILQKLAELEVLTGHVDEALKASDRALELVRATNPKNESWTLLARANLLRNAGRFADAGKVFDEALAVAEKTGEAHTIAAVHTDLGSFHFYAGNYGKATKHFVRAIELFQTLKEPQAEAMAWISLAEVYLITDSDVSADDAVTRARELAKKSNFPIASALADILDTAKKARAGETSDTQAAYAALFAIPEARVLFLNKEAMSVMNQVISMKPSPTPTDPALVGGDAAQVLKPMAMMLKGIPLATRGDYAGARAIWTEAMSLNTSRDIRASYQALIGVSYWKEGNAGEAIRYFRQATDTLEDVAYGARIEELLANYLGSSRRVYFEMLVEMLLREGRVVEAFEQTERARSRAFVQMIGNRRVSERGGDPELIREADIQRRQINAMEEKVRRAANEAEAARVKKELVAARHQYEALMVRVKASNEEYAALTTVEVSSADVIRRDLPERTTLISYFVSQSGVHAWVIDRSNLDYVKLPIDQRGMHRVVCWARQFAGPDAEGIRARAGHRGTKPAAEACDDAADANAAYGMLIAPLREKIRNERLVIVPHRELHYVPFAALHDAKRDRYLIEDYTILYAPSATAWRFLRQHESPVRGGALVLGNPTGAGSPLPGAEREAVMVAKHLGTEALVGTAARESLLYHLGGKIDLLHIAAHAEYDGANPLFSHIALAPDGEYDGDLKAQEILSDVDLTGVNLVVLSACNTAVGKPSGGDEIVGLTRSILYAGTPGVVSTLWQIDDVASTALMDAFYERLVDGAPAAEALRAAQLSMLRGDTFPSPQFWAAFTLTGDPQGRWKR